ncbi:aldo/keto reductase [Lentilactobacillus diolivorans]|uniref:Aldo keto reductase n=2 Tax=Lentilactobacillus diolivorans TaxID=179838 RepID=A0A0R1SMS8_9LACO|nr:aldo/keto reductase [Lentilactobacillus diolivorans]KRL68010.1 aldo keto reductase [Lentilactobacillus diolivorans DSM 14421]MDH5106239.1 aldo/keto reductase [Lentilactobacillus diolivorans]GEP25041.1 aldo/keto reductase [Lentilactobacillus diolivorans]
MKTIKIGNTNFEASQVALGIMRMGDLSTEDAAKALEAAVDAGINYIDSADIYQGGNSETKFKEALKASGISRDKLFIQSKGGIILDPKRSHDGLVFGARYDFSKQHLIDSVDGILERMGIDYLDSFLLHRPDPLMEEADIADAFDTLQREGKVRHFGVSNFNPQQVEMVQSWINQRLLINQLQFNVVHSGMIRGGLHVNMIDDASVDHDGGILEYARRKHMTIQAWSPFNYGLFAGMYINDPKYPELNKKLEELGTKYHASKNAIATAWILRHPAKVQVLLGTMNPEHIKDSAAGADINLTKQEWYDLYFSAGNDLP